MPLVALLFRLIFPPFALTRRAPSLDEVSILEFTAMVELDVKLTVPPFPPVIPLRLFNPVVAMIGLLTAIAPVVFTLNTPPAPPASNRVGSASPPVRLADLMTLPLTSNVAVLVVGCPTPIVVSVGDAREFLITELDLGTTDVLAHLPGVDEQRFAAPVTLAG